MEPKASDGPLSSSLFPAIDDTVFQVSKVDEDVNCLFTYARFYFVAVLVVGLTTWSCLFNKLLAIHYFYSIN